MKVIEILALKTIKSEIDSIINRFELVEDSYFERYTHIKINKFIRDSLQRVYYLLDEAAETLEIIVFSENEGREVKV